MGSGLENAHTPPIITTGSPGPRSAARSGNPAIRSIRTALM